MAAIRTGVWDNFDQPHAQSVEESWRERYALTSVPMSPISNAPDGFPIDSKGNRLPGFFDSQAVSKGLIQDQTAFGELSKAFKARQEQIIENIGRASGPDKIRLGLLNKAETASFEAERASLLGHPNADALLTDSRLAFTALMDNDRKHNHPIVDVDRDLSVAKPSAQEQFNWLQREDLGQSRKAPQRPHWEHSEYSELVGVANILQSIPLHRPTEVAPLAVRNAMRAEIQEQENAQMAFSKEQREAQEAVSAYLKAMAAPPFTPEKDYVTGKYVRGELVESGVTNYKNDPKNKTSPYAIVKGRDGLDQTVWGVDLPRAIEEGNVKVGNTVELRNEGTKAVEVLDQRTGKMVTSNRVQWAAEPHDFVQHEAKQLAKHEAAHPNTLRNVEESVMSWLDADMSNKAQYVPLVRASAVATDAPLAEQAVSLAKDLHADQVKQADAQVTPTPVEPAALDADMVSDAFNSMKIQGFLGGDKAVSYTMVFGGQVLSGAAQWDATNNRIVGAPTLDAFTQGQGIEKAMGGPVGSDDREYIQAALSGFLESKTQRFHIENGYEQAASIALPTASRLADRIDQKLAQKAEQAQSQGEAQGQASAGAQAMSPSVPFPAVDVQVPSAAAQAEAKQAPAVQAPAVEPEAVVAVPVVAVIEAAVPGQAMAQVEAQALQVETPKVDAAVFMPIKVPSLGGLYVKPVEINAGQRLDTQMSEHEANVKPAEAKADEIAVKMGIVGPVAQQAQRERLGISTVVHQQEVAQIPGQRRRLGM